MKSDIKALNSLAARLRMLEHRLTEESSHSSDDVGTVGNCRPLFTNAQILDAAKSAMMLWIDLLDRHRTRLR